MSIINNGNINGNGQNNDDIASNLQALDLNNKQQQQPPPSKSKRSRRAFHTEFNSPTSNTPLNSQSPLIPQQQQFQQQFQHPNTQNNQHFQQSPIHSNTHTLPNDLQQNNISQSTSTVPSLSDHRYSEQLIYSIPDDQGNYKSFETFSQTVPPDSTIQFHSTDQGTASSKFIRSTMYYVPETEKLRSTTKLPMAVTIRPFAPQLSSERPIETVEFQNDSPSVNDKDSLDNGPLRCNRCRAYINPSMQFTHNQRFICNICQFSNNSVPNTYASLLDARGYRVDKFIRPELHHSVYDIKVPKEYNFGGNEKVPEPLHVVYLIDITENSIKQNLPTLVSESIKSSIFDSQIQSPIKISIIAFDKKLHFFNLSSKLDKTQISILSDLDDPFIPFDEGLFADPIESQFVIEDVLNYIENLSNSPVKVFDLEPCFAVACKTAGLALEMHGGGKIISVLSNLPSWGPGGLKYKDNKAIGRTPTPEVEKKIFLPDNEYYKNLTKNFVEKSIGIDLHIVSHTPVDLSNLGYFVSTTGGDITRWTNLNYERDGRFFISKFKNSLINTTGYQGQLKLRSSNGLQVAQYYGTSSSNKETTIGGTIQDPIIPILNKDQTFTILLSYDGTLSRKLDCHFQVALLYTDITGERKVRVINLVLAVTNKLEEVFHFTDENAIVTTIVRDTLSFLGNQTLNELRESLNNKLVDVFTRYRIMNEYGHNKSSTFTNKLLFPESLKHLPIYILSFLKTNAIRSSTNLSADSRLVDLFNMLNMPIERLMYHLYPSLIEIHSLKPEEGIVDDVTGFTSLPLFKDLTISNLDRGVYILCDGIRVYIWIDPQSNIMLIKDLFGEQYENIDEIDPFLDELPDLSSEISQQTRTLVAFLNIFIIGVDTSSILIVRKGIDGFENSFKELLKNDSLGGALKASNGPNFNEYLSSLHKAIKVQLDSDKSSQVIRQSISNVEHDTETLAQRFINF
ncbi:SFB3 [Candida pseudojiufengensis]|uniref:SFB3 n=1 Tax=Candida pseudojiufengensis TaxID=497109 RepID=UPI002224CF04|nr:SFB3 [Candida pseudojiufengensis]KAI5964770.1 SFB3 [Candida pseudojiufengensis]